MDHIISGRVCSVGYELEVGLLHGRGWVVGAVVTGGDVLEHPGVHQLCHSFVLDLSLLTKRLLIYYEARPLSPCQGSGEQQREEGEGEEGGGSPGHPHLRVTHAMHALSLPQ